MIYKIKSVDHLYFIPALILSLTQIFISTGRYFFFVRASNVRVTFDKCLQAVLSAFALNSLIPGKGGDLVKAIKISDGKKQFAHLTIITIVERIFDLTILAIFTIIGSLLIGTNHWELTSAIMLSIILILITLSFFLKNNRTTNKILKKTLEICATFKKNLRYFSYAIINSCAFWFINLVIIWMLLHATGISISILKVLAFWPVAIFAGILPISISGFGTRDVTFALSIGDNLNSESIYAATFLYTFLVYWLLSIVSAIFLICKPDRI